MCSMNTFNVEISLVKICVCAFNLYQNIDNEILPP